MGTKVEQFNPEILLSSEGVTAQTIFNTCKNTAVFLFFLNKEY